MVKNAKQRYLIIDFVIVVAFLILGIYYASETNTVSKTIYVIISTLIFFGLIDKGIKYYKNSKKGSFSKIMPDKSHEWGLFVSLFLLGFYITITVLKFTFGNNMTEKYNEWISKKNTIIAKMTQFSNDKNTKNTQSVSSDTEQIIFALNTDNDIDDFYERNRVYITSIVNFDILLDIQNLHILQDEYSEIYRKNKYWGIAAISVNSLLLISYLFFTSDLLLKRGKMMSASNEGTYKNQHTFDTAKASRNYYSIIPFRFTSTINDMFTAIPKGYREGNKDKRFQKTLMEKIKNYFTNHKN
jgi:hypothetical protein